MTRRQLLVQSKRKPLRDPFLEGDNTNWLVLGFDPKCEIIWCNRTIIFLLVGCDNITSPAQGRFFLSSGFSENKGSWGFLSLAAHKIKPPLDRSYFVFALLVDRISSGRLVPIHYLSKEGDQE